MNKDLLKILLRIEVYKNYLTVRKNKTKTKQQKIPRGDADF